MRKPTVITTPFPTVEELAAWLRDRLRIEPPRRGSYAMA